MLVINRYVGPCRPTNTVFISLFTQCCLGLYRLLSLFSIIIIFKFKCVTIIISLGQLYSHRRLCRPNYVRIIRSYFDILSRQAIIEPDNDITPVYKYN